MKPSRRLLYSALVCGSALVPHLTLAPDSALGLELSSMIPECAQRAELPGPSLFVIRLGPEDSSEGWRGLLVRVYRTRSESGLANLMLLFEPPESRPGVLFQETDAKTGYEIHLYRPDDGSLRPVSGHESFDSLFETSVSYHDIVRIFWLAERTEVRRLPDAILEGRPVFVLEDRPALAGASPYDRAVTFVDRSTCALLKVEFYESDERRRTITADPERIAAAANIGVPRSISIEDLADDTRGRLVTWWIDSPGLALGEEWVAWPEVLPSRGRPGTQDQRTVPDPMELERVGTIFEQAIGARKRASEATTSGRAPP